MIWKWRCCRELRITNYELRIADCILYTLLLAFLIGCGVLGTTAPLYAQDHSTLTLNEYREKLSTLRTEIEQSSSFSATLVSAQKELLQVTTVILPSGIAITVTSLLSNVVDSTIVLQRIDTAIDQIDRSKNDRSEARLAQLQAILDRRPTNPLQQWWERFLRWLRDFFGQFERNGPPYKACWRRGNSPAG